MDRPLSWFKRGFQYDLKCNAFAANMHPAKPAITVFAESREDAIDLAVKELSKYGYSSITVDKIVSYR